MRCLARNKKKFYYCLYRSKVEVLQNGIPTGVYDINYSRAEEMKGVISPNVGESQIELFGNFTEYEKVIIIDNPNCPIDENSVLFLDDVTPTYTDNIPNFNYIVNKVAKTLNVSAYAVSKVK